MESFIRCPLCHSAYTHERHIGKKGGAILGGVSGTLNATETESEQPVINTLSGSHIAMLLSRFVAGAAIGAVTGSSLDGMVFDRFKCASCGHTFN